MPNVACLGDSITQGNNVNVPYPLTLARLLGPAWVGGNHGLSGDNVSGMSSRYSSNIAGYGYSHLVFLGGVNDIKAGSAASTVFGVAQGILDAARAASMKLVVCTVLPYGNYSGWSSAQQTQLDAYNASLRSYVSSNPSSCVLWDGYAAMGGTPATALASGYDNGDGLHPNQAGTDFIAAQVAAVMP